jgi:hypothetical protein
MHPRSASEGYSGMGVLNLENGCGITHGFHRLALQEPLGSPWASTKPSGNHLTPRMGTLAESILTARGLSAGLSARAFCGLEEDNSAWFRAETPKERQVPVNRNQAHRWMRRLDVMQERDALHRLKPVQSDRWPCDNEPG